MMNSLFKIRGYAAALLTGAAFLVACDPFGGQASSGGFLSADTANWPKAFYADTSYVLPLEYTGSCDLEVHPQIPGIALTRHEGDPPLAVTLLVSLIQPREDTLRVLEKCDGTREALAYPFRKPIETGFAPIESSYVWVYRQVNFSGGGGLSSRDTSRVTLTALGYSDGVYRFARRREREHKGTAGQDSVGAFIGEDTLAARKTGNVVEVHAGTAWEDALPAAFPYFGRDTLTTFVFFEGQPHLGVYVGSPSNTTLEVRYRRGTGLVSYSRVVACGNQGCHYGEEISLLSASPR